MALKLTLNIRSERISGNQFTILIMLQNYSAIKNNDQHDQ